MSGCSTIWWNLFVPSPIATTSIVVVQKGRRVMRRGYILKLAWGTYQLSQALVKQCTLRNYPSVFGGHLICLDRCLWEHPIYIYLFPCEWVSNLNIYHGHTAIWFVILTNFYVGYYCMAFRVWESYCLTHAYLLVAWNSVALFLDHILISSWVHDVGVGNKLINFIHSLSQGYRGSSSSR